MQFPFVGPSYSARVKNLDAQQCINLYPEMAGPNSKTVAALIGTPGLSLWTTLAGGGIRGTLRFSATLSVVVCGLNVYTVTDAGVSTLRGTIDGGTAPVSMATNGQVVMIVTGPSGFALNPITGSLTQITDAAFTGADRVDFLDGYFVFNKPGTGQFQITGLYTTAIDPLDFATAEVSPDLLVSLIVDHRELWLFGENSTEVYFDSGNVDFPFERIQGAFIEQGCAAKNSVAKMDNRVFWLTADDRGQGMVMSAVGYQPQRVSDHALEYAIGQMSVISDAMAYTYQQEGHAFYVLTFPTANQTWVLDASTNQWHQRAWRNPTDNSLNRHRSNCHMAFIGENIVGDWQTGNLYKLDLDVFTDNGDPIARVRACPHVSDPDYRWQVFDALQVDMQTGVGLTTGQGSDPKAMLQWSTDGGYSWSSELWAPIGKIGERRTRVMWRRLGRSRDRVFKVTITDPVRVAIVGASVRFRTGAT
ncbi:phage stabilization protein [Bacteriophage sp.]|nr:phage stabilization protein [Caudoviricetes sp.]UOF80018.1 phage stabilization protein [Bacteriophage sp.]